MEIESATKRKLEEGPDDDSPPLKKQKIEPEICDEQAIPAQKWKEFSKKLPMFFSAVHADYLFEPMSDSEDDSVEVEPFYPVGAFEEKSNEDNEDEDFTWSNESLSDFFKGEQNISGSANDDRIGAIVERIMAIIHMREHSLFELALDYLNKFQNKMSIYLYPDNKGMFFIHHILRNQLPWLPSIIAKNSNEEVVHLFSAANTRTGDTLLHTLFKSAWSYQYLEENFDLLVASGANPLQLNNDGLLPIHKIPWLFIYHLVILKNHGTQFVQKFKDLLGAKSTEGKTAIHYLEQQRPLMDGSIIEDENCDFSFSESEDDVDVWDQEWVDKYDSKVELETVQEFDQIVQLFKNEGVAMEDFSNYNEKFTIHSQHTSLKDWEYVKLEEKNSSLTTLFDFLTKSMGSHYPLILLQSRREVKEVGPADNKWRELHSNDDLANRFELQDLFLRQQFHPLPRKENHLTFTGKTDPTTGRNELHELCLRHSDHEYFTGHHQSPRNIAEDLLHQFPNLINQQDKDGNTPLHLALTGFGLPVSHSFLNMLLDSGANLSIANNSGDTPVITAAEHNINPYTMEILLKKTDFAILEVTNDQGNNVAHYLCDDLLCSVESYGRYLHPMDGDGTIECKDFTKQVLSNLEFIYRQSPLIFTVANQCSESPIDLLFEALLDECCSLTKVEDIIHMFVWGPPRVEPHRLDDQNEKIEIMLKEIYKCDWLMDMIAPQFPNFQMQFQTEEDDEDEEDYLEGEKMVAEYKHFFQKKNDERKKKLKALLDDNQNILTLVVSEREISIPECLLEKCEYLKVVFEWAKSTRLELKSIKHPLAIKSVISFLMYGDIPSLRLDGEVIAEIIEICNVWNIDRKEFCYYSLLNHPSLQTDESHNSESSAEQSEALWSTWTKHDMYFDDFRESVFNGAKMSEKPVLIGQYVVRECLLVSREFKTDLPICLDGLKAILLAADEVLINWFKLLQVVHQARLQIDSTTLDYNYTDVQMTSEIFSSAMHTKIKPPLGFSLTFRSTSQSAYIPKE